MDQSSCTEDRICHAFERCFHGLGIDSPDKQIWNAGMFINRWCLEELVNRDPHNYHILLQQILKKTREILLEPQYDQVIPLVLLFSSTLLKAPYLDKNYGILQEAYKVFHGFLSWPEPYSAACQHLLIVISQELRAPGISFQRMVREEQGIASLTNYCKTMTVFLISQDDLVPPEFLYVAKQLSAVSSSQKDTSITLITHAIQAALGVKCPIHTLRTSLQAKGTEELGHILATVTESLETAAASVGEQEAARESLVLSMETILADRLGLSSNGQTSPGPAETLQLPFPKCQMISWVKDNFDFLNNLLTSELSQLPVASCFPKMKIELENNKDFEMAVLRELAKEVNRGFSNHRISTVSTSPRDSMMSNHTLSSSWSVTSTLSGSSSVDSDFSEDPEMEDSQSSTEARRRPKKKSKSLLLSVERFSQLFKHQRSPSICRRVQSMGYRGETTGDDPSTLTSLEPPEPLTRRSLLPIGSSDSSPPTNGRTPPLKHMYVRRRPILSCEDGDAAAGPSTLVRVVIFGGDREAGRLARAYSNLQQKESGCPYFTKVCRLRFFFVPVKRSLGDLAPERHTGRPDKGTLHPSNEVVLENGTTDIAQMIGTIDPWYERSVLSLLSLSSDLLCQTAGKVDADTEIGHSVGHSLVADLVLYYCRHAAEPVLLQLYLAELTLAGGEKRKEVFVHCLELGHSAGTRAVKAMGAASKRFGIDGDREAVPLPLSISYNKVLVSRRSQWTQMEMVCTSINICQAGKTSEDSRTESLHLTMTEVLKIQSSKSKKSYNQHISVSEVKVDKVQVSGGTDDTTFAVCLDQDEKNIIQSVIRCDVSLCCKPGSSSDWHSYKTGPGQVQPLPSSYCSLLCLPIVSFSGPYP